MEIKQLTREEYEGLAKATNPPILLDFYADWCGPCRMLAPILHDVAEEHPDAYAYYRVNVDEQPELASMFGISVIPTLVCVAHGEKTAESTGYLSKEELLAFLGL